MKVLIDMNLSPDWVEVFASASIEAVHWSTVGDPRASDREIFRWASAHQYVVFTHDLDFGAILAATQAESPSVVQIRTQDVLPSSIGNLVINVLKQFATIIESGALVTVDLNRTRVHVLPIK